jgi:hypothetical protein
MVEISWSNNIRKGYTGSIKVEGKCWGFVKEDKIIIGYNNYER